MKTENRILAGGRTSGGGRPEGRAIRPPFPQNAKVRWEAIVRALRDQGYAIVLDGDVSWIVRDERNGNQEPRGAGRERPVFDRKTDRGGPG